METGQITCALIGHSADVTAVALTPDGRRAVETGAGLVVMGAYGHSRFREYVVGGVTREFLADFPVPVLSAH